MRRHLLVPVTCLGLLLGLCTASALRAAAGTAGAPTTEDVTELPKFVVEAERVMPPQESWKHTEIPGFEVLTSTSDGNTKRFLRDFQLLRTAVSIIWPAANQNVEAGRSYLILCGIGKDIGAYLPAKKADDRWYSNSVFLQGKDVSSIVVDLSATEVTLDSGDVVITDPYRSFYEAYFHSLVRRGIGKKPPVWLEEGLVAVLSSIEFDRRFVQLGKLESVQISTSVKAAAADVEGDDSSSSASGPNEDQAGSSTSFNSILAKRSFLPFDEFFAKEKPTGRDALLWKAQAFAFCHMCMFGEGSKYQKGFLALANRGMQAPITEAVFKECFGMDFKELALALRSYIEFTVYKHIEARAKKGAEIPEPPAVTITEASDGDIGRIKGETLLLAGRVGEAQNQLIAPYIRGSREPELLASLGLFELASQKMERARKFLEAAFEAKATDVRANTELARLRMEESLGATKSLSAEKLDFVMAPLKRAVVKNPILPDCAQLMANAWLGTEVVPSKEQLAPLVRAAQQHPTKTVLAFLAAQAYLKAKYFREAAAIAEWGEQYCPNPEGREHFKRLRASIPVPAQAQTK